MARVRSLCCFVSPARSDVVKARRGSAACICCIGPHHKPSSGAGLGPDADLSARSPLIGCCGSGDNVRGRSTTRAPTASRRLCGGVHRSRTPRRGHGQACCFPAAAATDTAAPASARAVVPARTPRTTPTTTPLGRRQQRACCVVRGPAQKLGRRRSSWFRSAARQQQAVAQQTTPRFPGRDSARGGVDSTGVKVHDARVAEEVEARAAAKKEGVVEEESTTENDEYAQLCREGFSREDVAAVTIQAYFRGHLARRASKALKSLVRLQAVARGAYVRRQAEVAMRCMQAMVRLQVRVRAARQMITTTNGTKPKPKEKEDGHLLLQS